MNIEYPSDSSLPDTLWVSHYDSPLGPYLLASSQRGLVCLEPLDQAQPRLRRWDRDGISVADGAPSPHNHAAARQLDEYFAGARRHFTVPLDPRGTDFDHRVWTELSNIPYGETRSYGQVAHAIGRPTASRAVGLANGRNPISIIVPCHRVIGKNGALVGYGGGLHRKDALLALEARKTHPLADPAPPASRSALQPQLAPLPTGNAATRPSPFSPVTAETL